MHSAPVGLAAHLFTALFDGRVGTEVENRSYTYDCGESGTRLGDRIEDVDLVGVVGAVSEEEVRTGVAAFYGARGYVVESSNGLFLQFQDGKGHGIISTITVAHYSQNRGKILVTSIDSSLL